MLRPEIEGRGTSRAAISIACLRRVGIAPPLLVLGSFTQSALADGPSGAQVDPLSQPPAADTAARLEAAQLRQQPSLEDIRCAHNPAYALTLAFAPQGGHAETEPDGFWEVPAPEQEESLAHTKPAESLPVQPKNSEPRPGTYRLGEGAFFESVFAYFVSIRRVPCSSFNSTTSADFHSFRFSLNLLDFVRRICAGILHGGCLPSLMPASENWPFSGFARWEGKAKPRPGTT